MSPMTSTTKFTANLFLLMAGLFAVVILALAACDYRITPEDVRRTLDQPCQEDEACWDCETMGNHICGTKP